MTQQYRALAVEVEQRVLNREAFLDGSLRYSLPPVDEAVDGRAPLVVG